MLLSCPIPSPEGLEQQDLCRPPSCGPTTLPRRGDPPGRCTLPDRDRGTSEPGPRGPRGRPVIPLGDRLKRRRRPVATMALLLLLAAAFAALLLAGEDGAARLLPLALVPARLSP